MQLNSTSVAIIMGLAVPCPSTVKGEERREKMRNDRKREIFSRHRCCEYYGPFCNMSVIFVIFFYFFLMKLSEKQKGRRENVMKRIKKREKKYKEKIYTPFSYKLCCQYSFFPVPHLFSQSFMSILSVFNGRVA